MKKKILRYVALQQKRICKEYSRMLVEQIQDALLVTSPEGRYIEANQAACKMFGYEYHELLGMSILDVTPEDIADKIGHNFFELKNKGTFLHEVVIMRKDKTVFPAEINAAVMPDGNYIGIIRDITQRKKAEKALQEHKEQLSTQLALSIALNNLAECVIGSKDTDTIIHNMMEIVQESLGGDLKVRLLLYDDLAIEYTVCNTKNLHFFPFVFSGNRYYGITIKKLKECRIITKNELEFVSSVAKLVEIAIQKIRYLSESIKSINNLRESEDKYSQLFENIHDIVYSIESNGNFISLNKAGLTTYGYGPEEVSSISLSQIIHPRYMNVCLKTISKIYSGISKTAPYVILTLTKDRKKVWIEVSARLLRERGIPIGIQGIARDITQRMKMEETIRKAEQEKNLILSSISEIVIYLDNNMNIKWANTAAVESCGVSIEDMLGRQCYEIWQGRNTPCQQCPVLKTIDTGNIQQREIISLNGEIWRIKSFPVNDQDGKVIGAVEFAKEITHSKQLEKEMARLDRLNLIGEMAASFGHEIRNPMSTVRGFLQMLSEKAECSRYNDYYTLMIEELDRANSIITEYLSLAKDKAIEMKKHNLNSLIESLYPLVLADAIHNDKYIELELRDTPDLWIDKKEIHQLILNLVRNGLEAMDEGGVLILATYMDGDETVLEVKDQGKGIDPEILCKLGIPFISTKENGTGLGLAVCYSIAKRHNAKIEVDTSPNGTTFSVRFKLLAIC